MGTNNSRRGRRGFQAGRGGWGLVALVWLAGCGGAGAQRPAERPVVRAETFWLPFVAPAAAGSQVAGAQSELRGKLFTLRVDDPWLTTSTWVKCPLEGQYHYEVAPGAPETVAFSNVDDAALFLPHGYQFFAGALRDGGQVRLTYVVAGRYVLDGEHGRTAGVVCNAATHYAKTIVVGAYRVELLDRAKGDARPEVGASRVEIEGTIDECAKKAKTASGPLPGCMVPLAYELRSLTLLRGKAKLRMSDTAGAGEIPSPSTMPRRP